LENASETVPVSMAEETTKVEVKPAIEVTYPEPVEFNQPKRGRGRPKGSKNKSAPVVENMIAEPIKAEPNTVLVASVAEEVMRKIAERREKSEEATARAEKILNPIKGTMKEIAEKRAHSEQITKEAEEALKEGREIEFQKQEIEFQKKVTARGPEPRFQRVEPKTFITEKKKIKPKAEEFVLETPEEKSRREMKEEKEGIEAFSKDKAQEIEDQNLRKKNYFEERERLAKERRDKANEEAQKIIDREAGEKDMRRGKMEVGRIIRKQEGVVGEAIPRTIMPETPKSTDRENELERVRLKYKKFENLYSQGEKEPAIQGGAKTVDEAFQLKKGGSWWEKTKSGWNEFWTKGRK